MSKGLQHLTSTAVRGACLNPARKTPAQRLARTLLVRATTLSEWARPMSNILPWIYILQVHAGASGATFSVNCNVERLAGFADFWRSRVSAPDTPAAP